MADRTLVKTPATGTSLDVMTDERTVVLLSDDVPAKVQYIGLIDGTPDSSNLGIINEDGELLVKDTEAEASLASIDGKIPEMEDGRTPVALPAGFATEAAQDTGNGALGSIDNKTPSLGQALAAVSVPVVLPADQIDALTPPDPITGFALEEGGHLESLDAKLPALSGGRVPVDASGVAVPVTDNGASLTVDDGGGSLTVDGTVGVSGVIPGTTATSLGKAEDQASADGDVGVMALAIRKDVAATTVGSDGDYAPLEVDANGRLHVIEPSAAGSLAALGATTGVAVTTDTNGSIQQYLRGIVKLMITAGGHLVTASLAAGANLIGKVGFDRTTPGTTNSVATISGQDGVAGGAGAVGATVQRMTLASDDPAVAALGAPTGAAITTDVDGTIQRYLRGLVKLWASVTFKTASTAAAQTDPALVVRNADIGTTSDAAVAAPYTATGSVIAWLRTLLQAFGTAGTPAPAVLGVQGVAGGVVMPVGGTMGAQITTTITRPADTAAYAVGDSINTSTSAPTLGTLAAVSRVASGSGYINRMQLSTNQAACVAQIRVWLFSSQTTPFKSNDNAAFLIKDADKAYSLGYVDLPALSSETGSDTAFAQLDLMKAFVADAASAIYFLLETKTAFTPANAQTFTLTVVTDKY